MLYLYFCIISIFIISILFLVSFLSLIVYFYYFKRNKIEIQKKYLKISKCLLIPLISFLVFLIIVSVFHKKVIYVQEMNQIKSKLNEIEGTTVVNIWGHRDITLEEISARLRIEDKGEIVLGDLSSDVYNYPNSVILLEIGGYSFTEFSWNGGISSAINIGIKGELGHLIGKEFYTIKDVINNYDMIFEFIENLNIYPEINHIETEISEHYLLIHNRISLDQDPIFNLIGVENENEFEFAKTLKWNRIDSFYNK